VKTVSDSVVRYSLA